MPESEQSSVKMVICMRTDLNMRKGKMVAQGAHASMAFITRRLDPNCCHNPGASTITLSKVEEQWLDSSFTKICVGIDSLDELMELTAHAQAVGIEAHLVEDNGLTEFHGEPTYTCIALGPDYADKIDQLTQHLRLL